MRLRHRDDYKFIDKYLRPITETFVSGDSGQRILDATRKAFISLLEANSQFEHKYSERVISAFRQFVDIITTKYKEMPVAADVFANQIASNPELLINSDSNEFKNYLDFISNGSVVGALARFELYPKMLESMALHISISAEDILEFGKDPARLFSMLYTLKENKSIGSVLKIVNLDPRVEEAAGFLIGEALIADSGNVGLVDRICSIIMELHESPNALKTLDSSFVDALLIDLNAKASLRRSA